MGPISHFYFCLIESGDSHLVQTDQSCDRSLIRDIKVRNPLKISSSRHNSKLIWIPFHLCRSHILLFVSSKRSSPHYHWLSGPTFHPFHSFLRIAAIHTIHATDKQTQKINKQISDFYRTTSTACYLQRQTRGEKCKQTNKHNKNIRGEHACKSSENMQVAEYARFEKVLAG